jgi:outer membrane protein OmpA-like peptidoglycan-associated protein
MCLFKTICYFVCYCCIYLLLTILPVSAQNQADMMKNADTFFQQKQFKRAVDLYEQIRATDSKNIKAIYKAGICYLELGVAENALDYFEVVKEAKDSTFTDFNFWYAKAAYYNQDFDTALSYLNKTSLTYGQEAMILLQNIKNALALQKESKDYVVENLGENVNTAETDFAPLLSRDKRKIIFTRNRHTPKMHEDGKEIIEYEIVETTFQNDNVWAKPHKVTGLADTNLIALQLADDDHKLYANQQGKIVMAEAFGGAWKKSSAIEGYVNTPPINSKGNNKGCFVYHYGQKMILVSNHETKNGNYDLFESYLRRDGTWAIPTPIADLNTLEDELSPFITEDEKTLYFSSKGHQTIGGYDIFKSTFDEKTKTWGKPENVGMPINSVNDDTYFSLYDNIGYFASQRMGGMGKDDIYKVYLFSQVKLTGKVFNRSSNHVIKNSKIRFITDKKQFETETDPQGNYEVMLPFKDIIQVKVILDEKVVYEEQLKLHIQHKKTHTLSRNYYVDLTNNQSPAIPTQETQIFGLVSDAKTGQRFTQPIVLLDSLGKEIRATSSDQNGYYNLHTTLKNERYALFLHKKGYMMTFKEVRYDDVIKNKLEINIEMPRIEVGEKFVLRNIYFNSGSDILSATSFPELNKLHFFLKENPDVRIEISGHTDNVGNPDNNLKLSENRAKSVFLYLTNKAIAANRLIAKGFGDSQPLASNDDEKDGRELNRRIEIKILPMNEK